ncbi:MAG: HAD-IB family hydrolase [Polaromonas sp.]|nr:HAD-IB family hydrolase [Polaromonas sp.]
MRLTLFDLDHTILNGDSDVLWCDFLIAEGLLDKDAFGARNADMAARYQAGTVGLQAFADFYVGTLADRTPADWQPQRQAFLDDWIIPRITPAARARVNTHLEAGDLVVMTTATNRFITELTAQHFGIPHLIATEPALVDGHFSGHTQGELNMREGKVVRLKHWLQAQGLSLEACTSTAYSDSINDLPLLESVKHPVVVDPDPLLRAEALQRGWDVISLR